MFLCLDRTTITVIAPRSFENSIGYCLEQSNMQFAFEIVIIGVFKRNLKINAFKL